MKRGTAAKVILGKDTLMDVPAGIVHGTDVILGGKAGLLNDFGGLVLSNNLMLGKKVSRGTITTVTVRGQSPLVLPDAIAGSLQAVKAFGGTEQRNLPLGYTQFGRIHFDGNCYFDTGIVINSLAATVKLMAAFDSQTSSAPCFMWGYMGGSSSLPRWGVALYSVKWLTSPNTTAPYGTADTDKHIFITESYDNSGTPYWRTYVDGELLGGAAIVSSKTITRNALSTYIGARNNNGTADNYVKGNFTYLEITQDGVCLAKIYPCKRDSDNVLGLYNTVTNEFLPNLGTGTLTADIFASPTPDTPMDIVSNNGVLKYGQYSNNIFNKNDTASIGNWYSSASNKIATAASNATLVMRAKPGATYYYKHCSVTGGGCAFYTEVEDWGAGSDCSAMSGSTIIDKDEVRSITVSENAKWVFFNYGRSNQTATFEEQLADYMVSLTPLTSDTPYEPYRFGLHADGTVETIKDSLNNTATAEMLLKVGDYQDVQSILDGVVTRNIGVKVLDGTENWVQTDSYSNPWVFYTTFSDGKSGPGTLEKVYCTHFQGVAETNPNMPPESAKITVQGASPTISRFYVKTTAASTIALWKAWLADQYAAGTPVIVVYPLATPTTESVTGQTLQVQDGDNTLEITQASLDNLELEATYKSLVQLTIQEVEDANLNNNVEVTIS